MFDTDDLSSVNLPELIASANWQAQYRLITQWGKLITHKSALRADENLLQCCEVSAWLAHEFKKDIHYFAFDSDSRVINGLAAMLLSQVHNKTTKDITAVDFPGILLDVGMEKHLTPSRSNGLRAILAQVDEYTGKC